MRSRCASEKLSAQAACVHGRTMSGEKSHAAMAEARTTKTLPSRMLPRCLPAVKGPGWGERGGAERDREWEAHNGTPAGSRREPRGG